MTELQPPQEPIDGVDNAPVHAPYERRSRPEEVSIFSDKAPKPKTSVFEKIDPTQPDGLRYFESLLPGDVVTLPTHIYGDDKRKLSNSARMERFIVKNLGKDANGEAVAELETPAGLPAGTVSANLLGDEKKAIHDRDLRLEGISLHDPAVHLTDDSKIDADNKRTKKGTGDMEQNNEQSMPSTQPEKRLAQEIPFEVGQSVTMLRTGKNGNPDWLQDGWKVDGFDEAKGKYLLSFDDKETGDVLTKPVSPANLTAYNSHLVVEAAALSSGNTVAEFAPQPSFSVGDSVTVRRTGRDSEGKRDPSLDRLESGWKVIDVDAEAGTVLTESPDKQYQKTYAIVQLDTYQHMANSAVTPEMIVVPDFVKAARTMVEGENTPETAGELRERASEDLGEEATPRVVTEPLPEAEPSLTIPERISNLVEGLSGDDKLLLRTYADATEMVKQMQAEGRGHDSTYWQQVKGQTYKELTPAARALVPQYIALFSKWVD